MEQVVTDPFHQCISGQFVSAPVEPLDGYDQNERDHSSKRQLLQKDRTKMRSPIVLSGKVSDEKEKTGRQKNY